jgi:hypothetical protein
MSKHNDDVPSETSPFEPVPSVNPDEMVFAIQIFQAGLRLRMPVANPESKGIELGSPETAQTMLDSLPKPVRDQFVVREGRIAPKDNALHRGVGAVLSHYADHPERQAIFQRTMGFYFLVNDIGRGGFQRWEKPSEEDPEVTTLHPAILEAVAVAPVGKYGKFEENEFFAVVEQISKEKYSDD